AARPGTADGAVQFDRGAAQRAERQGGQGPRRTARLPERGGPVAGGEEHPGARPQIARSDRPGRATRRIPAVGGGGTGTWRATSAEKGPGFGRSWTVSRPRLTRTPAPTRLPPSATPATSWA